MEKGEIIVFGFTALLLLVLVSGFTGMVSGAATSSTSSGAAPTNMVVDFASTSLDSKLGRGDSGVLNLVIKNAGGMPAEKVEVWLPGTESVHIDKRIYVGTVEAGASKTIPIIIRVDDSAITGLNEIQVYINFNGFGSDGKAENNQLTIWAIPFRVYANPSIQITTLKTTYYKDTTDDLILNGTVNDELKDLEAKVTSNCFIVIGPSQIFIGDVGVSSGFKIKYNIKPTTTGACTSNLGLTYTDQSGGKSTVQASFGLNVEDAGVDYKITNISYNPTGPGEIVDVAVTLKNIGDAQAEDTTVSLGAADPFAPIGTLEKYIGTVRGGEEATAQYKLSVSWDAATQTYTIPLTITYKVGGTTYTDKKDIGIDVSGKVILEIISVDTSTGTVRIDVANLGTRDANAIKATLVIPNTASNISIQQGGQRQVIQNRSVGGTPGGQGGQIRNVSRPGGFNLGNDTGNSQSYVSYKSDIKPGKDSIFTFATSGSGPATLLLEYSGENNQRITQREQITLQGRSSLNGGRTGQTGRTGSFNIIEISLYALIIIVAAAVAYKLYKRRKKK